MHDLISRQAAIDAFMKSTSDGDKAEWCKWVLEQLPSAQSEVRTQMSSADCISRAAAIEAVYKNDRYTTIKQRLDALPSAQPEIIRCKDCKHKGTKNCVANAWTTIFGVMVKDDFYCGLAERRTDEQTV